MPPIHLLPLFFMSSVVKILFAPEIGYKKLNVRSATPQTFSVAYNPIVRFSSKQLVIVRDWKEQVEFPFKGVAVKIGNLFLSKACNWWDDPMVLALAFGNRSTINIVC